ncbi:MAG: hypothetical protein ABW007_18965 [Chitinophagaceae bacterium]
MATKVNIALCSFSGALLITQSYSYLVFSVVVFMVVNLLQLLQKIYRPASALLVLQMETQSLNLITRKASSCKLQLTDFCAPCLSLGVEGISAIHDGGSVVIKRPGKKDQTIDQF